jgi:NAD(P)-dependent dehydrogenase (short-subunit alcohol dehydrogenase family)
MTMAPMWTGRKREDGTEMSGLCAGRVAIVTGAGRGIGREHALMLAAHGAKVVVNDVGANADGTGRDETPAGEVVAEIRRAGGEAVVNRDDVGDWQGAKRLVDQAVETFGRLDVVVNNAGILRDRMLANMSEEEWDAVIKVHLKGTFAPSRHAVAYWRDQAKATGRPVDARIIDTSSVSGLFGNVGQTNYGAAKAGVAAFTVIAARELGRYGITVNAVSPSAQTRMTEGLRERTPEEIARRDPRWVAPIITWLASEESREVTGRIFFAGNGVLCVGEGWHHGPSVAQIGDPTRLGPVVHDLVTRARRNAGMDGKDLD